MDEVEQLLGPRPQPSAPSANATQSPSANATQSPPPSDDSDVLQLLGPRPTPTAPTPTAPTAPTSLLDQYKHYAGVVGNSLAQGAAGTLDLVNNLGAYGSRKMAGLLGIPGLADNAPSPDLFSRLEQSGEVALGTNNLTPSNTLERYAAAAGRGIGSAVPTLPLGGPLANIAGGAVGAVAGQAVDDLVKPDSPLAPFKSGLETAAGLAGGALGGKIGSLAAGAIGASPLEQAARLTGGTAQTQAEAGSALRASARSFIRNDLPKLASQAQSPAELQRLYQAVKEHIEPIALANRPGAAINAALDGASQDGGKLSILSQAIPQGLAELASYAGRTPKAWTSLSPEAQAALVPNASVRQRITDAVSQSQAPNSGVRNLLYGGETGGALGLAADALGHFSNPLGLGGIGVAAGLALPPLIDIGRSVVRRPSSAIPALLGANNGLTSGQRQASP